MAKLRRAQAEMLTPREYAARWGYHENTVYRWIRQGLLSCQVIQLPQRHRYLIEAHISPPMPKPGPVPKGGK